MQPPLDSGAPGRSTPPPRSDAPSQGGDAPGPNGARGAVRRGAADAGRPAAGAADGTPAEVLERLRSHSPERSRYTVVEELSHGGMGAVLKVWDADLRRPLAMKVQRPGSALPTGPESTPPEDRATRRFLDEARVTGQLEHPGILPVHELGVHEGRPYFTMPLVRGQTLRAVFDRVHAGDAEWTRTRALGAQLKACEAMAYAHSKGVIHRDLKPANVMVGRFGEVYVMDWGLAKVVGQPDPRTITPRRPHETAVIETGLAPGPDADGGDEDEPLVTADGEVIGTPAYMSPEQASGDLDQVDSRSDIYALGAILYRLLTGRAPYTEPGRPLSRFAVLMRVIAEPPERVRSLVPDVSSELEAICEKAMSRDPERRYADAAELARDLRAYLEGRVVAAYETGSAAELRKWFQRNRGLAVALGAAAVLTLLVSGLGGTSYVQAKTNAEVRAARDEARAEVLQLSDAKRLRDLRREAAELWPPEPGLLAAYGRWMEEATALSDRLELHRATLEELRAAARPMDGPPREWVFESTEEQWRHDTLAELVEGLERFGSSDRGLVESIEARIAFASTVAERTLDGPAASWEWSLAVTSIADPDRCPMYGGLGLVPQLGLYPLGRDPRSGYWEFALVQSGDVPERDPRTGELVLTDESAVVLVLLPGATATIGAQNVDPQGPNYDPQAKSAESDPHPVELEPFFVSKYELTQGQWLRTTGSNPSYYNGELNAELELDLRHPVEHVSRPECEETLRRLGLRLPTEAQWEYAARGGTTTPWWTGRDERSLAGAINCADWRWANANFLPVSGTGVWKGDDGHMIHAPVGTHRANPYGLCDTLGNVQEWCSDDWQLYPNQAWTPSRMADLFADKDGVVRGGSFDRPPSDARVSSRRWLSPYNRSNAIGVRPVRVLDD